ncbi:ATP-dependent RNA helicase DHX33-like [Daphnia pulicaria]|uniref:ATP-dependent RNA helicase DHX33-like n=1 Tax=Daphnia pulicaria TaxID=35523 RepID=UPI001EEA76C7|nr:ATP-dependent RNA helicase DHX33-like [Daphnia pulicaria]
MRMTDSSSQNNNDGANGSHGKRPAQNSGNSGASFPKIVKFNGNVHRPPGRDSNSPNKRPMPAHYSREDLLAQRQALPIYPVRQKLLEELRKHQTLIVIGETGSGKTTQIPQYIFTHAMTENGTIAVTQPRRVAAITLATRVAQEMGAQLGTTVGYTVRFEDMSNFKTKIKFLTDGMLLREAMLDPLLKRYSVIILDEAHERTIHTDVLFSVVKTAQKRRAEQGNNKLKIVIMSATMDVDHFSHYFNKASVVYLEGRQFPIQVFHAKQTQEDYLFSSLVTLFQIHKDAPADHHILIFLTGQEEIEAFAKSARTIAKDLQGKYPNLKVCPLFANLPQNQQMEAFNNPPPNTRKVVLSTNIAETSVTIDGIRYVIDCGRVKARTHMPATGMDILRIQKIAQAQAWQRAGRAGRQAAGFCYRAYTLNDFEKMAPNPIPEIQRCSLTTVVLQLLALGVQDPLNFDFMDKPPTELIEGAMRELHLLGGIQSTEKPVLTEVGQQMAAFPLDPRFTKLILASKELGCTEEIVSIVALLSADSIMINATAQREQANNVRAKFASSEGDHMTLLNIFRAFRTAKQNRNWCFENFVNYRNLLYAVEVRKQLAELCERMNIPMKSCNPQTEPVRRCLLSGLFLSVAEYQREGHYLTLGSRQTVAIHPSSVLFHSKPSCIVFTELVQTGKRYVRQVTLIDQDWIEELPKDTLLQLRQTFRGTVSGPHRK